MGGKGKLDRRAFLKSAGFGASSFALGTAACKSKVSGRQGAADAGGPTDGGADSVPDAAVDARMRDRIGRIEIETGHLVQMVNELLDLARIESEALSPLADEVDMAALARTTAVRMTPFAERQGVVIAVDAPEALPAVRGDEHRLGQVLLNLVHNAIKFSPAGAPVTIRVAAAMPPRSAAMLITFATTSRSMCS